MQSEHLVPAGGGARQEAGPRVGKRHGGCREYAAGAVAEVLCARKHTHLYLSSPRFWCSTRMIARHVSSPMKSGGRARAAGGEQGRVGSELGSPGQQAPHAVLTPPSNNALLPAGAFHSIPF